jgi:hypothetical protein
MCVTYSRLWPVFSVSSWCSQRLRHTDTFRTGQPRQSLKHANEKRPKASLVGRGCPKITTRQSMTRQVFLLAATAELTNYARSAEAWKRRRGLGRSLHGGFAGGVGRNPVRPPALVLATAGEHELCPSCGNRGGPEWRPIGFAYWLWRRFCSSGHLRRRLYLLRIASKWGYVRSIPSD